MMLVSAELDRIAAKANVILLYHSIADCSPGPKVHNITPEVFEHHLESLAQSFDFVSLDTLVNNEHLKGQVAVTFDDGFKNVFDNALPILKKRHIPATVFLNPRCFDGRLLWREKINRLISLSLEKEFLADYPIAHLKGDLYKDSKYYKNNSQTIESAIDDFFDKRSIQQNESALISHVDELVHDDLVSYGNHTWSHCVLSSLSYEQQEQEIKKAHDFIHAIASIQPSAFFSIPFGAEADYNSQTLDIVGSHGYKGALLSRSKLHQSTITSHGMALYERIMPKSINICATLNKALD